MLAPAPSPAEADRRGLVTEAEALADLLGDFDVRLTVRLDNEALLYEVGPDTPSGAADVMRIATKRFEDDPEFREHMIAYVGSIGDYVASAPGINTDLKTASAQIVCGAAEKAGLIVLLNAFGTGFSPTFMVEGATPSPSAHLLMKLITDRFVTEPDFETQLTNIAAGANRLQRTY